MSERETPEGRALVEGSSGAPDKAAAAPLQERNCLGAAVALFSVVGGAFYVINPGMGVFEVIPDNIPLFGNLDEAAATTALVLGLQYLFRKDRKG